MDYIETIQTEHRQVIDKESQLGVALDLKKSMMERIEFLQDLPKPATSGRALGVSKRLKTHFSINSSANIAGVVEIDQLKGRFRLPLAKVRDIKYYHQQVKLTGELSVEEGEVVIYSPFEMDFWQMARLFVDHQEKYRPESHELTLKGYSVYRAKPGQPTRFNAELLAIGDTYYLLMEAKAEVTAVKITLD